MFGFSNLWVAIAGAVLFGLVVFKSYSVGYDQAAAGANVKIAQIKIDIQNQYLDQIAKLQAANKLAEQNQKDLSSKLDKAQTDLEAQLQINEDLASKDPNANTGGIGLDSVNRLNSIQ
jgi:ABC-type sugar transport system substrate-binding protein